MVGGKAPKAGMPGRARASASAKPAGMSKAKAIKQTFSHQPKPTDRPMGPGSEPAHVAGSGGKH
jgi:hypothetical protein